MFLLVSMKSCLNAIEIKHKLLNCYIAIWFLKPFDRVTMQPFSLHFSIRSAHSKKKQFSVKSYQGITIIELILVIAIFLTLSIFSTVFYTRFLLQNTVSNTTDKIVSSLRKAQVYSMASKRGDQWSVNYTAGVLTLFKGTNFGGRDPQYDEKYTINSNVTISGLVTISFSKAAGLPTATPTITVSSSGTTRTLNINSAGVITR